MTGQRARLFAAFGLLFGVSACPAAKPGSADASAASTGAAPSSSVGSPGAGVAGSDEVRPVYPKDYTPVPLATRLCAGLYDMPESRRAACCQIKPQAVVTSECVRMLSSALSSGALVLAEDDVTRCLAALDKTYDGCDWPGPTSPDVPAECRGITHGTKKKGEVCRSSLECSGDLRCRGLGPTQAGLCDAAGDTGSTCNLAVDPLAGYVRQMPIERTHPECAGVCNRHRCVLIAPTGAACEDRVECGPGSTCKAKKCAPAVPAKLGQACPDGACEPGAECIVGRCMVKQAKGAACTVDFECVGGCIKPDGGAKGVCGPSCSIR